MTYYERTQKFASSQYGTVTARLSSDSQLNFGDCALSLSPALDAVATPSGHIYSREAILEYLVQKTAELKQAQERYNTFLLSQRAKELMAEQKQKERELKDFEQSQKVSAGSKRKPIEDDTFGADAQPSNQKTNALARTSYWLADFQPTHVTEMPEPPPERPLSPHSGQPLRRKELRHIVFKRSDDQKVQCALSDKTISTQPAVALPSGQVVLQDCFEKLIQPTMVDPFSGKKFKPKHVLHLVKGRSGFSATGQVEAKKYRPTIT